MAKAKPAVRPAAKRSKATKAKKTKRKGQGEIDDRPIIVKGHALPTTERAGRTALDAEPSVVVEGHVPANSHFHPGSEFPFDFTYPDTIQPTILTIQVRVGDEIVLDQKVDGFEWRIVLSTV